MTKAELRAQAEALLAEATVKITKLPMAESTITNREWRARVRGEFSPSTQADEPKFQVIELDNGETWTINEAGERERYS